MGADENDKDIVFIARIEPTFLAFQVSGVTITPPRFPDIATLSMPTGLCSCLPERSVQTASVTPLVLKVFIMLTINYTCIGNTLQYTYIQGRLNNYIAFSFTES